MTKNNRFSFDDLYFFYKAAEIGSYSLAAKFFSVNSTTVSRRIIALEDSLKVKLVEVSNNSFSLTMKGKLVFDLLAGGEFSFDKLQLLVNNSVDDMIVSGEVLFSLPPGLGISLISRHIPQFIRENPGIKLNLCYQNKEPELAKDNVDLALALYITNKHPNQKFKKIASFPVYLLCTREYQEKYGIPESINDLSSHFCVGLITDSFEVYRTIKFRNKKTDEIIMLEMPNNITTNSAINNMELIKSNEVIAGVWDYTGRGIPDHLIHVLPDYEINPISMYLLKHPYRQSKVINIVADFIEKLFKSSYNSSDL